MLPSTSSLQRCADSVETFGQLTIPFHSIRNTVDGCEGFYFRVADIMREVLKSGNLLDSVAKLREIMLSLSLDGATLTKNLNHTLCGLKFNDVSNPLRRSRHAVFPIVCVCGGETKLRVRGLFSRVIKEAMEAALEVLVKRYGIKALILALNSDMSAEWKISDCGGAAKNTTYPCTKCTWTSDKLHTRFAPSASDCGWCVHMKHTDDPEWRCRHSRMCTKDHIAQMKDKMKDFAASLKAIDKTISDLWENSSIKVTGDPRLEPTPTQKKTITSIHFDITKCTRASRSKYNSYVTGDLQLRHMDIEGSLTRRQRRLQIQLGKEWLHNDCLLCQERHGPGTANTALVMMMSMLPCILHMEIRVGIKMITMLLKEGLTNAKNDNLQWIETRDRTALGKRCESFMKKIRHMADTQVCGTVTRPAQTRIPFDTTTNTLGVLKLDNGRVRKFLNHIEELVDLCVIDPRTKPLWKSSIQHYRVSMVMLRNKERLTRDEIWAYQKKADYFFRDWIDCHAAEGMTNYVHMIGSGHVLEYLLHWGNLANHSQQGWEAFNSQFKTYFFNRTQRGGSVNKGRSKQSRMLPMARWVQRRTVFMAGYSEKEIWDKCNNVTDEEMEKARTWVKDNGGTIEFGKMIDSTAEDANIGEGEEDLSNWEEGVGPALPQDASDGDGAGNDTDGNDPSEMGSDEEREDYDSVVQSTDDEQ